MVERLDPIDTGPPPEGNLYAGVVETELGSAVGIQFSGMAAPAILTPDGAEEIAELLMTCAKLAREAQKRERN